MKNKKQFFANIKPGDIIAFLRSFADTATVACVRSVYDTGIVFSYALNFRGRSEEKSRLWVDDSVSFGRDLEEVLSLRRPTKSEMSDFAKAVTKRCEAADLALQDAEEKEARGREQNAKLRAEANYWKKEAEASPIRQQKPSDGGETVNFNLREDDYAAADDQGKQAMLSDISRLIGRILLVTMNMIKRSSIEIDLVADGEERLSVKAMRDEALDEYRNKTGLATPRQQAFRAYLQEVMELYRKTKSLRGQTDVAKKYGVSAITTEQFFSLRLNDTDYYEQQGGNLYADRIYEETKKR